MSVICGPIYAQEPGAAIRYLPSGIDLAARDLTVKPGDDFNTYASGSWEQRAVISEDDSEVGMFHELEDRAQLRLRKMFEQAADNSVDPIARKIGDLYTAFMNDRRIEELGDRPLRADLDAIRNATDKEALANLMGNAQRGFGKGFFLTEVKVDRKKPDSHRLVISQAGLGMSDREMYRSDDFKTLKAAYRDYAINTLKMIGWADPDKAADSIIAMETQIAEAHWSATESGDRVKMYNPMRVDELEQLAPAFPWRAYLKGAGLEKVDRLVVSQKTAFPKIASIFQDTSLETIKAWEALQTVDEASTYLPKRFVDTRFAFRGKAEEGLKIDPPRWKRGVDLLNTALDKAVGKLYVAQYFPPKVKEQAEALIANLKKAMETRIQHVEWMTPQTKKAALEKLHRLSVNVGYPEKWRDYSGLTIDRQDLYGSVRRAKAFNWEWETARLSKPVDRFEWWKPPQTVEAYSDFGRVGIFFPAAILQPPFFDPEADPAANYGAIGTVIGHEITHQFDSQGRKFDATGKLRDWWAPEDAAQFEKASAQLATQFDAYEGLPGIHLNGKLELGENIADLGGLLVSLEAYHEALKGKKAPVIAGTTGDQRVFLGWAQFQRLKARDEVIKEVTASGVHALPRFRVIGSTRNVDKWYEAFDVKPGDRYYLDPKDRVRIW